MTDARARMVEEFGRKIAARIEEVMQREVDIAMHVFTPPEITEMVLKVARGVSLAAILVAIQAKRDDVEADTLFDIVALALDKMIAAKKPMLAEIIALTEQRGNSAR